MAGVERDMMDGLDALVGEWIMAAALPPDQTMQEGGRVGFEWLSEGSFLVQRWEVEYEEAPDGIAIIGPDESGKKLCQHYFDTRGVARTYEMSLIEGVWKLWRDYPGFSQRFTGTFSEDGRTIEGTWETSEDGTTWQHDFDLVYTRQTK